MTKGFFGGFIFRGAYDGRGFCVSICVGLDNKNNEKHKDDNLNQCKTANPNRSWAYIWEGLLSEGYLRLRFGGTFFREGSFFVFVVVVVVLFVCFFVCFFVCLFVCLYFKYVNLGK